jgi:hypothetical protein
VELEFSVNLCRQSDCVPDFALLQLRPMSARAEMAVVEVFQQEIEHAFCYSSNALGNGQIEDLQDIVYVKPEVFNPGRTPQIAREIGELNAGLVMAGRKYLLIGPGRWGSADRWLGIPVSWAEICGVGAMIETTAAELKADPSQGSHFFHNITTLGIAYATIADGKKDFLKWDWLNALPRAEETRYVAHVRLAKPFVLKIDGRSSQCVMYVREADNPHWSPLSPGGFDLAEKSGKG